MDYAVVVDKITNWLQRKVEDAGAQGVVLGLSGGIDSAVVAALAQKAFAQHTLPVIMPAGSSSEDVEDAWLVAKELGLPAREINLDASLQALLHSLGGNETGLAAANIKPRLRMTVLYYLAAEHNYLVLGTGNKSEIVTGFFTKYGDGGVDLEPIGQLVKTQVFALAEHLGLPARIIEKQPTAGLWPGQTDEGELGFTYRQLDEYILNGTTDRHVMEKIQATIRRARHKQEMPPVCQL